MSNAEIDAVGLFRAIFDVLDPLGLSQPGPGHKGLRAGNHPETSG